MKTKIKTNIVPLKMFRTNTEKYIREIANGSTFVVMRKSRPIFRMVPVLENWETVIDFTEISPNGVPVDAVLKALKKYDR